MKSVATCILFAIFLAGCALTSPPLKSKNAIFMSVRSPLININDAGFIELDKNRITVQIYSAGASILELKISGDKVCFNKACQSEARFNERLFNSRFYNGLLADILNKKPIFSGDGVSQKEGCEIYQNYSKVQYCANQNEVRFTSPKTKIIIKDLK